MRRSLYCHIFVTAVLGSCRSGVTVDVNSGQGALKEVAPPTKGPYAQFVDSDQDLPPCSATQTGYLIYVRSTGVFKSCDGASWSTISIKSDKGDTGAVGPQGDAGAAGPKGDTGATGPAGVSPLEPRVGPPLTCDSSTIGRSYVKATNGRIVSCVVTGAIGPFSNDSQINAIAAVPGTQDNFYIAGYFSGVGGVPYTTGIAKWNGSQWTALGTGIEGDGSYISALAIDSTGNLYAGGYFSSAGGVPNTKNLAKWDGSQWTALSTGIEGDESYISALAMDSTGNLYAGGVFDSAGGVANTKNLAKWGGSQWTALGTGAVDLAEQVAILAADFHGNLFAWGRGANGRESARWDGSQWTLPTETDYYLITRNNVHVDSQGNVYIPRASDYGILKWDGSTWSDFASTPSFDPYYIAANPMGEIYVYLEPRYIGSGKKPIFSKLVDGNIQPPLEALFRDLYGNEVGPNAVGWSNNGDVIIGGDFVRAGDLLLNKCAILDHVTGSWQPCPGSTLITQWQER